MLQLVLVLCLTTSWTIFGMNLGDKAPNFKLKDQNGHDVSLIDNKGKTWTVLYFYPKADTPGCTKQACAFRDAIDKITKVNARVYGISTNNVSDLKAFEKKYHLKFVLLSDEDGRVCEAYGTKMPLLTVSKRHTFIIDPDLNIRSIDRDVDPAVDADKVVAKIKELKSQAKK